MLKKLKKKHEKLCVTCSFVNGYAVFQDNYIYYIIRGNPRYAQRGDSVNIFELIFFSVKSLIMYFV